MVNTTLKTLSEISGLSISTVSRALNDHPDISQKTKQLVHELATTLDYEPNVHAIHLRTRSSKLFALIVPSVSGFFYDSFIAAVEEEARRNQYALMILQSVDDPDVEMANIRLCRQSQVSGVFACLTHRSGDADAYTKLKEAGIPVVFFDKVPERTDVAKVCVADAASAALAAETILRRGKKKVLALFGNPNLSITRDRYRAFTETILQNNSGIVMESVTAGSSAEAESFTMDYLPQGPDVVFCMSDEILVGAMLAIQKQDLRAGEDIGVISISNGFMPTLYHPRITYVETSGAKLGKLAFDRMLQLLAGSSTDLALSVETMLVEGGSL